MAQPSCRYTLETLVATHSVTIVDPATGSGASGAGKKGPAAGLYCKFCRDPLESHSSASTSTSPDVSAALVETLRNFGKSSDSNSASTPAATVSSVTPASKLDLISVISPGFSDRDSVCPASFSDVANFVIMRDLDPKSLAHIIMAYRPPTVAEVRFLEETFPSVYRFDSGPESAAAVGLWVMNSNPYSAWNALESISKLYGVAVTLAASIDPAIASVLTDLNVSIAKMSVSFFANVGRTRFGSFIADYMKSRADRQPIGKCRKDPSGHVSSNPGWLFEFLVEAIGNSAGMWKKRVISDSRDLAGLLLCPVVWDAVAGKFFDLEQFVTQLGFWFVQRPRDGIYTTLADKWLSEVYEILDKLYDLVIASGPNKMLWELSLKQSKLAKFSPASFASGDLPSALRTSVSKAASLFSEAPPAYAKARKSAASSVASSNSSKGSR
jgi:hypothetical protein